MKEQFKANSNLKKSWEAAQKKPRFKNIQCSNFQELKRRLLLADDLINRFPDTSDAILRNVLETGTISEDLYANEPDGGSDQPASGLVTYVTSIMKVPWSLNTTNSHGKAKLAAPSDDKQFLSEANKFASKPIFAESVASAVKLAQDYLRRQVEEETDLLRNVFVRGLEEHLHKQIDKEVKKVRLDREAKADHTFLDSARALLAKQEENAGQ
jgi:hypothetical protein